jgi:energy-coupling factor transporter transmembrane protein EcfT
MIKTLWTLFLIFAVLKFTSNIDWSWIWVFVPFWGPLVLFLIVFLPVFTYFLIKEISDKEDVHRVE